MTTVTYQFANGAKQAQPINVGETYFNPNFRHPKTKKLGMERPIKELFAETANDIHAIGFTIDAEDAQPIVVEVNESAFTAKEKYQAKRDHKEFQKNNPAGFKKSLLQFQAELADRFSKGRVRFNIKQNGIIFS